MSKHDPYINKLIFSKYLIRKKVGKGSFGTVYQGVNTTTNEKIALKVEKREQNDPGTLENEALRLVYLQGEGIPRVYCYGHNLEHNLLVEELLGKSLEDIFNANGKPFSLKTVCVLGIEMINRIQYIHSKHYIHRDIKPDNFMTGRGTNEKKIYIIDFGLAKKFYSVSKGQHIKFITGKHLIGTARYCGRNAHRGFEQGRRDDIESIGYVLMYFLLGQLPWQGLKVKKNEDQFEKIAQKKYTTSFEELTAGQPEEFLLYFKHVDNLEFEDKPNYVYLIGLFQNIIDRFCKDCFYDFDWKKDSYSYYSREMKNYRKSVDISLIVNKNKDASAVDYSNEGNEEEEENENEENENEDDENQNYIKNKKIKKKEVFMGEDKTPIDNEEGNNDDFPNKNKAKIHRSRSVVNINQKKNKKYSSKEILQKKKNFRGSQIYNRNIEYEYNSKDNRDKEEINNDTQDNNDNIENENNDENQNKINSNYDSDNPNTITSSKREGTNNYNSNSKRKSRFREEIDEYPPFKSPENKYKPSGFNSSINKNKFNLDYNNGISDFSNNIQNEDDKDENNDMNQTEEGEHEDKNMKNNDEHSDIHDMSFEPEKGSKKKRRNRSSSVDDKKYKEDNIKCKCIIF